MSWHVRCGGAGSLKEKWLGHSSEQNAPPPCRLRHGGLHGPLFSGDGQVLLSRRIRRGAVGTLEGFYPGSSFHR